MDIKKLLVIFSFLIFLLISPSFAHDNNVTDSQISANYGDVYFNSSSLSDGDGSIENPYNKITMDRINNYATLHLADGEYNISGFKTISSLNIVGESYDNTIIRHDGLLFTVLSELSLNNLTLSGVTIKNQGIVNSTNVIFSDAAGSSSDRYNNVFGGVFDNYGTNYVKPKLYLDNCIFKNNHAEYGGAIYLINGEAFINNCLFEKNIAYNYGGAIACDGSSKLTIKNTRFKFDSSTNDAGGALYLKNSSIIIENSNFTNCNSLFGGAICDLNSDLSIDNAVFSSNGAVYDGGAIFKMYGDLSVLNSKFNFNAANNGGAIFADNSSSFVVKSSRFSSNTAKYCGGVIYSLLNKNSVIESNIYTRNKANSYPNVFETDLVNLFIGNNNYSMFKYNPSVNELPSKYSSVDEGYVTPIKDQQTSGNCWAFTAISTLESCILKASNITYDLSEENLKNIIELYSDYGWNMVTNGGGYDNMAIGYFASWLGPILEENDSFDDYSTLSPVLDSIMHVQNVIFLGRDNFTDNNRIKEAIFKYGAVGTGLYYSGSYLFGDSYYYSGSASENHAVTIVGWDDDYPYYKFRNPAPANGAWIVKNSWDDEWGDRGYFYVSYYDSRFAKVGNAISSYTFVLNDTLRYDKNYQYDIIGLTKFISSENEIWYENIFNSTDDEVLSAFSTYFASKSNWTSYIYVNDELLLIQNGTSLPGYYTFDFNDYIYLNKGDSFKIVVKLENDGFVSVPVSERTYSNKIFYKEGVSFFSYDGVEWYDLYNFAGSQVACMKAFTIIPSILLEINVIDEYNVNDLFNITSIISDNSLNGSVIYNIDGNLFTVNVTDGFANLPMSFNKSGIYDCSAYFVGEGKFSNKVDFTVNIKNIILNTTILLDNVTSVVGEVIVLNASVFDENGVLVSNGNVTWVVGDDSFVCPVVNGSAVLEVSFDEAGNYSVVVLFDGVNYYSSSKTVNVEVVDNVINTTVVVDDVVCVVDEFVVLNASVFDENGVLVSNGNVTWVVGDDSFVCPVVNGSAVLEVSFDKSGNYSVVVLFDGVNYYSSSKTVNVEVVDKVLNTTVVVDDVVCVVDEFVVLNASVFDENGVLVSNGNVTWVVGDDSFVCPVVNGSAVLEVSFDEAGNYSVVVLFDGVNYYSSSKTVNVEVVDNVINTTVVVDDVVCVVDEFVVLNASVFDENGVLVSNGNVTWVVGDDSFVCPVVNGSAVLEVSFDKSGNYSVVVLFDGVNYYSSSKTVNVEVVDKVLNTTVVVDDVVCVVDEFVVLNASVFDENGVLVSNGNVTWVVGDDSFVCPVVNGSAVLEVSFDKSGNYSVVVLFDGVNYYSSSKTVNVEVVDKVLNTSILLDNVTSVVGEVIVLNASVFDENGVLVSNGNVTWVVGDDSFVCPVVNGSAFKEVSFNKIGNYTVVASFNGMNYNPSSKTAYIVINKLKLSSNITVNSSFVNTGDEINIISNVISDNLTVNGGVAVFLINKTKRYVVNISDNQAILDVIFNQSGNYIVDVSFDHEKYEIDNCSVIVNVFDKFSRISISDLKAYVGDKCNISVLVFDANGNMIDTGILNIIINDKIYSIDLSKDYPLLEIIFNKSRLYNVFAEFDAFGYQKSFNSSVIEVCKKDLEVNFKIDDIYYGEDLTISVQSNDDADVEIIINNLTYHLKTNAEFIIKNTLNAGNYESILYFNGDEKYNSLNKTANFNVNKIPLSADFKVKNKTFFIHLSQSINDTMIVKINNQDYVIHLTNGEAKLTLDNFDVGSYSAVVNYANPNYEEIHENYSFEIPKINTKVLVNDLVKYYKSASRYELTLIDENGNYLANKSVIISISGVNYTRITDEKGKASIGINLNSGTYAPVVYFEGDEEFNFTKNSSIVIVKSTIEANNLVKCYRNASQFYATILDYDGNIVKNQVISFNINGVFYNRTTNENGVVKLNINLSPGEYIITTLNLVTGERASNNIAVLSLIVENKNLVKYYRNASQYCVKILDDEGNPVGAGKTVRFNINGVFYERQTNESGIVKLNINLNPGEYIITAEYKGCCVSNEITIKPILTANDLTKRYGDSDQFVATLVDGQGKAYAGQYVEFNINGVFYKRLTGDNGQAKLNIRLMPGLYIITSSFGGFSTSNTVKIV